MSVTKTDALVIGAGVAGLYQLHRLRQAGYAVTCIDAAPDIGGTWHWNCYPGARLDSPSYTYQYWFSEDIYNEWEWSERFATQPEIKRYFKFVADKLDLWPNIALNTRIKSAIWDATAGEWRVASECGREWRARYLISCVGMLSAPKTPLFPEQDRFAGTVLHTARWPQEGIDLRGKRVGVVGVGATGIQVIQTLASAVEALYVFQRTPQNIPEVGVAAEMTPEERLRILEDCWQDGSLKMWVGTYPEVLADEAINDEASEFVRAKIRARIDDPAIADKLIPKHYGFGTYRVPLETNYYDAFNRNNVHLVDVKAHPIEGFTADGLMVDGQEYALDVLIFATGFDAGTGALSRVDVRGIAGQSLSELWRRDIRSTLGLQVHGFPNLFTVAGPLAPSTAFCNMTTCLQQQVDWITDAILYMREQGKSQMEASAEKEEEWIQHHDEIAESTLLMKTNSWYTGANIEGKPRRLLSYVGGVGVYKEICEEIRANNFAGFNIT